MAYKTIDDILLRDQELVAYMNWVLDHPNDSIIKTIETFWFALINPDKYRENLIVIGNNSRRHPYRVPPNYTCSF
jgi:hypothetical protein